MIRQSNRRKAGFICTAAVSGLMSGTAIPTRPALAQDATPLPEIVVTSPSPVVKKHKKQTASKAPAKKSTASATPAPPSPPQSSHIDAAAGTPIVADDAFVPITVVTERDIQAQQGATLTDSLQNRPGITASNFAPG